jgi:hypothetical protein
MIGITFAEEAAAPFGGLKQHSIAGWVRGAIGYTVLHHMNIHAGAQRTFNTFLMSAVYDFLDGEISLAGLLPMDQCRGGKSTDGLFRAASSSTLGSAGGGFSTRRPRVSGAGCKAIAANRSI